MKETTKTINKALLFTLGIEFVILLFLFIVVNDLKYIVKIGFCMIITLFFMKCFSDELKEVSK